MKKYEKPEIYYSEYKPRLPWLQRCTTYQHKSSINKLENDNGTKTECPRIGKIIKAMLLK